MAGQAHHSRSGGCTHWEGVAPSASDPSTTLCWLLSSLNTPWEPWPLSSVLSAGEGGKKKHGSKQAPPNITHTTRCTSPRNASVGQLVYMFSSVKQDLIAFQITNIINVHHFKQSPIQRL